MLAKRLFQKAAAAHLRHHHHSPENASCLTSSDVDLHIILHYGIPTTASILAFDPIQNLLAIGTLDGRIKVIGSDNIECLFISPEKLPYKYLEFIQNEGYLMSVTTDNNIQVWNLRSRSKACSLHWESNITAFSIIGGSSFIYIGDDHGVVSVLLYDEGKMELLHLPYHLPSEASQFPLLVHHPVVAVLPQPCSSGTRVLIAYESGQIVLWDILKAQVVILRGEKVLQLKNESDSPQTVDSTPVGDNSPQSEEKEISAVCWASCDGSIVAVGYVDGDILFWKTFTSVSGKGTLASPKGKNQQSGISDSVVKLQLSPAEKRLPVIVLEWWPNFNSNQNGDGQLLIYGGDEIGSDEVLTVLNIEWSSGMETIHCFSRVDLSLPGFFADVAITSGTWGRDKNVSLFILTNPGQLQIFDVARLSASVSEQGKKMSASAVDFASVVPTSNPLITVASIFCLPTEGNLSKAFTEEAKKFITMHKFSEGKEWPWAGGGCNHLSSDKDYRVLRVYMAGYQDGSVRIWDATSPVLSFLSTLENKITDVNVHISVASISKLELCIHTLQLAVGDECGLVRIFSLVGSEERNSHFVTESTHEVQQMVQDDRPSCRAAFSFFKSRVQALKFTNNGAKLAAGYDCRHVVVFDMNAFSVTYVINTQSCPISLSDIILDYHANNLSSSGLKDGDDQYRNLMVILTKDGTICTVDADVGNLISSQQSLIKNSVAVSMHVIESSPKDTSAISPRQKQQVLKDAVSSQTAQETMTNVDSKCEVEKNQSSDHIPSRQHLNQLLVILCCNDIIRVYSAKSIIKGDKKSISKVRLTKPCLWTNTIMKDGRVCGLVLVYLTGDMEIRSLPNLELLNESSLTSILRWDLKANMERMMSSTPSGHITLVNGSELVFLSILSNQNDFRIPESLPALHDEVVAAAAKAAISFSLKHKKKQGSGGGLLHGLVKGFKKEKFNPMDLAWASESFSSQLVEIFLRNLSRNKSAISTETELDIDDIEIDEPVHVESSSHGGEGKRDNKTYREKLFDGSVADVKPKVRSHEEILATYRKAGDASSVAGQARNKLLERQEKLQRISKQTEELRNGAEDFASLANELVKVMENRKWWQI